MSTSQLVALTKQSVREAAQLYFEPLSFLFRRHSPEIKHAGSLLPAVVATELKYSDVAAVEALRQIKKHLKDDLELSLLFSKHDLLYAELLKQTLESKKLRVSFEHLWRAQRYETSLGPRRYRIVILSKHFSASKTFRSSKQLSPHLIGLKVDSSESSVLNSGLKLVDAVNLSILNAAVSLLSKIVEGQSDETHSRAVQPN